MVGWCGGGRGAKAKVHSTFWVVGGVGGVGWVVVVVVGGRRQRGIVPSGRLVRWVWWVGGVWWVVGWVRWVGLCLYGFGRWG